MTKLEVRDELKETEGNPQIKQRVRRIQRDMARRNMMKEIPNATAVIVNPTHFAVAIRYEMEGMAAPRVLAKGKNYLALQDPPDRPRSSGADRGKSTAGPGLVQIRRCRPGDSSASLPSRRRSAGLHLQADASEEVDDARKKP